MDGFYGGMPLKVGGEERKREGGMENVFFFNKNCHIAVRHNHKRIAKVTTVHSNKSR